ncbi:hypothetical protein DFH09DRAFT_1100115 [Mycena vulgaris]|nr:hypothetical protein DFH09DRAFT_1100115 [Mycena vulgaris]
MVARTRRWTHASTPAPDAPADPSRLFRTPRAPGTNTASSGPHPHLLLGRESITPTARAPTATGVCPALRIAQSLILAEMRRESERSRVRSWTRSGTRTPLLQTARRGVHVDARKTAYPALAVSFRACWEPLSPATVIHDSRAWIARDGAVGHPRPHKNDRPSQAKLPIAPAPFRPRSEAPSDAVPAPLAHSRSTLRDMKWGGSRPNLLPGDYHSMLHPASTYGFLGVTTSFISLRAAVGKHLPAPALLLSP